MQVRRNPLGNIFDKERKVCRLRRKVVRRAKFGARLRERGKWNDYLYLLVVQNIKFCLFSVDSELEVHCLGNF